MIKWRQCAGVLSLLGCLSVTGCQVSSMPETSRLRTAVKLTAPPEGITAPPEGITAPPEGITAPPEGLTAPPEGLTTPPADLRQTARQAMSLYHDVDASFQALVSAPAFQLQHQKEADIESKLRQVLQTFPSDQEALKRQVAMEIEQKNLSNAATIREGFARFDAQRFQRAVPSERLAARGLEVELAVLSDETENDTRLLTTAVKVSGHKRLQQILMKEEIREAQPRRLQLNLTQAFSEGTVTAEYISQENVELTRGEVRWRSGERLIWSERRPMGADGQGVVSYTQAGKTQYFVLISKRQSDETLITTLLLPESSEPLLTWVESVSGHITIQKEKAL